MTPAAGTGVITHDSIFIGGQWVASDSEDSIEVVSPFTEEVVGAVPDASEVDMNRAIDAARSSFDAGEWRCRSLSERIGVLRNLSVLLGDRQADLAKLITEEMGTAISLSHGMQGGTPKIVLDAFLRLAETYPWSTVRNSSTGHALVRRGPVGVVAAIVPWNAPLYAAMLKLAPALLAGCSVVLKPAPETPLDAFVLADLLVQAGIPEGVVSVVPAGREVSELLVRHPGVDKVSFTGSSAAGRRIAALCGQDLRRVTLELGGKSAAIVLDDADLPSAVETLATAMIRNTGQSCVAKSRILVSHERHDELVGLLAERASKVVTGDPMDPRTEMGPVATARQRERVEEYIRSGREDGFDLVVGGGRPSGIDTGYFIEPTVFAQVDPRATIAQEEIFGPVLAVIPYKDEREALEIANSTPFGLSGSIWTSDLERGLVLSAGIRTGTVELNGSPAGVDAPSGGYKQSGIGREFASEGFDAYVELQSIGMPAELAHSLARDLD